MGWVLIIEENQSIATEIKEAITLFDPKTSFVQFNTSTDFLNWMESLQRHDPEITPPVPADKFLGIITAIETWKFRDVKLIGKFKALFIQKKFAENEDEIFVIFTAYDHSGFQKKRFEYRSVNNLIFKPFDKLVLQQLIDIARLGRQPVKTHLTYASKTQSEIEMLKEISLTAISEIGFKTTANQPLAPGAVAKYYADFLETRQHRSALAQCLSCTPTENPEIFNVELRFFALDQTQSFNIQKLAQTVSTKKSIESAPDRFEDYAFYFVKKDGSSLASELSPTFERFYDHSVTIVDDLMKLSETISTTRENSSPDARAKKTFVFIDHGHIAGNEAAEIESLKSLPPNENFSVFILSPRIFAEPLELSLSQVCEDIFYAPFNKSYAIKTLKKRYPGLRNREEIFEYHHLTDQRIHVSNPVKIVKASETEMIIEYHREIHLGSFREFHFRMPNELEVPTMIAQCNYTTPTDKKEIYHCHFIFFGTRDTELKFIRRWMLTQYVEAKQKENSG